MEKVITEVSFTLDARYSRPDRIIRELNRVLEGLEEGETNRLESDELINEDDLYLSTRIIFTYQYNEPHVKIFIEHFDHPEINDTVQQYIANIYDELEDNGGHYQDLDVDMETFSVETIIPEQKMSEESKEIPEAKKPELKTQMGMRRKKRKSKKRKSKKVLTRKRKSKKVSRKSKK